MLSAFLISKVIGISIDIIPFSVFVILPINTKRRNKIADFYLTTEELKFAYYDSLITKTPGYIVWCMFHRVDLFWQSSSSKKSNADLANVMEPKDYIISEKHIFWSNTALPHSDVKPYFYNKLTEIRQKAETGLVMLSTNI